MDNNIGKKLDGRYEITELIGVGGMADVYKGNDVIDNKSVAIKILKKEFAENEEFLRRFRNESKAIAVLSHPNIVKIYDVGFSERLQYIIMEYIDGITLKEYMEEEKKYQENVNGFNWKDSVHFIIQILRALQHAHDKGVVHRDIKPQNIMMLTDGTIKVMDFGIAKFAREQGKTATDQAIGSVHYISPEQASGEVTDEKSDIYSIGVMLYEMLAGKKPFDAESSVSVALMNVRDTPERPKSVNPNIPNGLEEIVLKAMEKSPANRYQSAKEMIDDVEKFKGNTSISFGYYSENAQENNEDGTRYFEAVEQPVSVGVGVSNGQYSNNGSSTGNINNISDDLRNNLYDYQDDDDDEEEEVKGSLFVPVLTAITIVVIIAGVVFIASLVMSMLKNETTTSDYSMPVLVGMDYNEAVAKWGNSINIVADSHEYNEMTKDCIFEQDIEAGTPFNKGDTVKVKVSNGMQTIKLPDGVDINYLIFQNNLKELGLSYEIKKESSDTIKEDQIIRTEPEAFTEVSPDTTIILYVSMGSISNQAKVEDLVGMTIEDAIYRCNYKSITNITIVEGPSYEDEGIVYEQSIAAGEIITSDQELILYVSNGVDPDGAIEFVFNIPSNAEGRFVADFIIDNKVVASSGTFIAPQMSNTKITITGTGEQVYATLILTNQNTGASTSVGSYTLNFAKNSFTVNSENIDGAFSLIQGIHTEPTTEEVTTTQPPTEPPTEPPTQPPTVPPTQPPATQPPATEPPATEPPATEPPATEPPATEPSATEPSVESE